LPHLVSVFLVNTEDDSLIERVRVMQEIGNALGYGLSTSLECHYPFKVTSLIFLIRDLSPVAVEFVFGRMPAGCINIGYNSMNTVGRKEAIVYALSQAVSINRVPEVAVGITIFLT
jgi:hypothetical protein